MKPHPVCGPARRFHITPLAGPLVPDGDLGLDGERRSVGAALEAESVIARWVATASVSGSQACSETAQLVAPAGSPDEVAKSLPL